MARNLTSIHHGDCLDVMAGMEPESVDAIVTDPPYLLRFMGKSWDGDAQMSSHATPDAGTVGFYQAVGKGGRHDGGMDNWQPNWMQSWHHRWAEAALRVAKPSAYLLAFGGTRTVHRLVCAIEDAGWIIRDMLVWAYASGFPKSKASLKPAWEPIVMARKPGPLRMLAIDACRIGYESEDERAAVNGRTGPNSRHREQVGGGVTGSMTKLGERHVDDVTHPAGRWPANVILTDPIFDGGWEGVVGGGEAGGGFGTRGGERASDYGFGEGGVVGYGDSGTYSRFFLVPKADRADREPVLGGLPERVISVWGGDEDDLTPGKKSTRPRTNLHPTVKPTDLMRHLVRLVTPAGGIVLDPFLGSGSTAIAAEQEGFEWIGIEKEAEYVAIAEARLNGTQRGLAL